jgi:hypothetical protein
MRIVLKKTNAEARCACEYSVGHDSHKASTRRLQERLAYVMRVDDRASVAYAAASARSS